MVATSSKWDLANFVPQDTGKSVPFWSAFGVKGAQYRTLTPGLATQAAGGSVPLSTFAPQAGTAPDQSGGKAPTNAKHYTQSQLQQLWVQAGGNPKFSLIASAIAEAESGGDAGATNNDSNGSTDKGLWQINTVHGSQSTYDPLANAKAAVAISSNGTNWGPWATYGNGSYQKFMGPQNKGAAP
jgi:hypothetical protein